MGPVASINVVYSLIVEYYLHDNKSTDQLWYMYKGKHSGHPLKASRLFSHVKILPMHPTLLWGDYARWSRLLLQL